VDDTQRNIVGGGGIAVGIVGVGILVAGGSLQSLWLVALGTATALIGFRRPRKVANVGIDEHRTKDSSPSQIRHELKIQLSELQIEGERIARLPSREEIFRVALHWQDEVSDLLENSLDDPTPAQWWIDYQSPDGTRIEDARLAGVVSEQVRYLGQSIRNLDQLSIRTNWRN
jgi:hypothetical protein